MLAMAICTATCDILTQAKDLDVLLAAVLRLLGKLSYQGPLRTSSTCARQRNPLYETKNNNEWKEVSRAKKMSFSRTGLWLCKQLKTYCLGEATNIEPVTFRYMSEQLQLKKISREQLSAKRGTNPNVISNYTIGSDFMMNSRLISHERYVCFHA